MGDTMKKSILILAAFVFVGVASARPYGTAGCGLGNLWFGKNSQILAATTNGSSANQMFGISTGTSNCTDDGKSASLRLPIFVEANKIALANDIARGNGETVTTLAKVMGCSETTGVGEKLQSNFASIFPNERVTTQHVSETIVETVKRDSRLAADCKGLI